MSDHDIPLFIPRADNSVSLEDSERKQDPPTFLPRSYPSRPLADELVASAVSITEVPWRRKWFLTLPALTFALAFLAVLYFVSAIIGWAAILASVHPVLSYVLYGAAAFALGLVLLAVWRSLRGYLGLLQLEVLRREMTASHGCKQTSDRERGHRGIEGFARKLALRGVVSSAVLNDAVHQLREHRWSPLWGERACAALYRDIDLRVKAMIENEAVVVGLTTAISPSGPIDVGLVCWRNSRLIFAIAKAYGVRPGAVGSIRLLRRVATNMAAAGVSQEVMQMLYAAYGPAAVGAISRALGSVFGALTALGGGAGVAVAGGIIGAFVETGATAATHFAGPMLQGVLNAILTIRVGLAAQEECRLLPFTPAERSKHAAGILSAIANLRKAMVTRKTTP